MKGRINYGIASGNGCLPHSHKPHTDIFNNISRRERDPSHFLGIYLGGLRYDGNVSVVDRGIKKCEKTKCKSGIDLLVLVYGVDEVNLVVSAYVSVIGKLCRHINCCVNKSVIALGRNTLDDNHILVSLF